MNISEGEYCVADQPIIPEAREENQNAVPHLASDSFHITIGNISILFVPSCTFIAVNFCQLRFLVRAIRFWDRIGNRKRMVRSLAMLHDENRKLKD